MKVPSQRIRRALWLSAAAATAAAVIVPAVTSSVAAQPASLAGTSHRGPGYPPPGGIYAPFTNCPLKNPLMQESLGGDATGCIAGHAVQGSIKIGNITTPVTQPVTLQLGVWDPPNAQPQQFQGGSLPPRAGTAAQLVTKPDLVPESLTTALGCPSSDPTVESLCQQAQQQGGQANQIFALAQSAGNITNFGLFSWTEPVKFKLINPLLGNNCYIGSDNGPVVLNPQLSIGPGGQLIVEPDPNPTAHPNTAVLEVTGASATDNTFTAPGVTGCGPGGSANIAVDQAIDTSAGLPAASGTSSLTLSGTFSFADCFNASNQASILLSAFKASVGTPPHATRSHRITMAHLHGHFGLK